MTCLASKRQARLPHIVGYVSIHTTAAPCHRHVTRKAPHTNKGQIKKADAQWMWTALHRLRNADLDYDNTVYTV
jgi:hypothetical protein